MDRRAADLMQGLRAGTKQALARAESVRQDVEVEARYEDIPQRS